jgi:hypothetical protein
MTDPHAEGIRYLLGPPSRRMVFDKPLFVWEERMDNEKEMMMWMPSNTEEFEMAERFWEAVQVVKWDQVGEQGIDGRLVGLPPRESDAVTIDHPEDVELPIESQTARKNLTMEWTITPYERIGPLSLGMTRDEARNVLTGHVFREISKKNSRPFDAYKKIAAHLYYDEAGRLEFIEMFTPCEVLFNGLSLLHTNFDELQSRLTTEFGNPRESLGSYVFPEIGVAFYSPYNPEPSPPKAVAIFEKGYYEKHARE